MVELTREDIAKLLKLEQVHKGFSEIVKKIKERFPEKSKDLREIEEENKKMGMQLQSQNQQNQNVVTSEKSSTTLEKIENGAKKILGLLKALVTGMPEIALGDPQSVLQLGKIGKTLDTLNSPGKAKEEKSSDEKTLSEKLNPMKTRPEPEKV